MSRPLSFGSFTQAVLRMMEYLLGRFDVVEIDVVADSLPSTTDVDLTSAESGLEVALRFLVSSVRNKVLV